MNGGVNERYGQSEHCQAHLQSQLLGSWGREDVSLRPALATSGTLSFKVWRRSATPLREIQPKRWILKKKKKTMRSGKLKASWIKDPKETLLLSRPVWRKAPRGWRQSWRMVSYRYQERKVPRQYDYRRDLWGRLRNQTHKSVLWKKELVTEKTIENVLNGRTMGDSSSLGLWTSVLVSFYCQLDLT